MRKILTFFRGMYFWKNIFEETKKIRIQGCHLDIRVIFIRSGLKSLRIYDNSFMFTIYFIRCFSFIRKWTSKYICRSFESTKMKMSPK